MPCCLARLPNASPKERNSSNEASNVRSCRPLAATHRRPGLLLPGRRLDAVCRAAPSRMTSSAPQHLLIESNGLFGHPKNWEVMNQYLERKLDPHHYLIYASEVNQLIQTFDGIDACGNRLVSEIEAVVQANPSLKYISMMGHSMGGLMIRYAAGLLYNPETGLVAGRLEPIHFITLATPHLGCDVQGESQIPMFGLVAPMMSKSMADSIALQLGKAMIRRTGPQLLMEDRDYEHRPHEPHRKAPLLARLAFDVPGEASYYSAIHAFWSRTCYGNMSNDHLVGWANSTLRYNDELPNLNLTEVPEVKGVIREDPTHFAHIGAAEQYPTASGTGSAPANQRLMTQQSLLRQALEPAVLVSQIHNKADQGIVNGASGSSINGAVDSPRQEEGNEKGDAQGTTETEVAMKLSMEHIPGMPRETLAAVVLARLRSLPWARVDCAWRDAQISLFAHNHIQVTRGWLNWDGESVCGHITDRFLAMEQQRAQIRPDYVIPAARGTSGQGANSTKAVIR